MSLTVNEFEGHFESTGKANGLECPGRHFINPTFGNPEWESSDFHVLIG